MAEAAPRIEAIYSQELIADRIGLLASHIAESAPDNLLVIAILKGSFVFAADLLRAMHHVGLAPEVDFLTLSSYREGTVSTGQVRIVRDIEASVAGREVLIIDDILESGRTLAFAKALMAERGAKRARTCVLLDKPVQRASDIAADFCAFECPDLFVVGYGMDLANRYRELPFVGHVVQSPAGA